MIRENPAGIRNVKLQTSASNYPVYSVAIHILLRSDFCDIQLGVILQDSARITLVDRHDDVNQDIGTDCVYSRRNGTVSK